MMPLTRNSCPDSRGTVQSRWKVNRGKWREEVNPNGAFSNMFSVNPVAP